MTRPRERGTGEPRGVVVPFSVSVKLTVPVGGMPRTVWPVSKSSPISSEPTTERPKKAKNTAGLLTTETDSAGEVLALKLLSPEYETVSVCWPTLRQNGAENSSQLMKLT